MKRDRLLADYLLGKLDEAHCETLEEQYFVEPESLEEIVAMQEELFDDYATGKLRNDDRLRFEERFLQTAGGQAHLRFLQGVFDWTALNGPRDRPWFLFSWLPEIQPVMGQEIEQAADRIIGTENMILDLPADGYLLVEMELDGDSQCSAFQLVLNHNASGEIWRSEMLTRPTMSFRLKTHIRSYLLQEGQCILSAFGRTPSGSLDPICEQIIVFRKA